MPKRIQRKRTKGWKMPENCVYVGRPTIYGNTYYVGDGLCQTKQEAVDYYREWLTDGTNYISEKSAPTEQEIESLRGKDLACFCKLDQPCHADVLLELANQ